MESKYPNKIVKEYHRRRMIANELFTTEDFYCSCLHALIDMYKPALAALKGENGEPLVPDPMIKSLFSTVQILMSVNDKLRDKLKKRMENWFVESCRVGNIFDKSQVGFLKVYISFVYSYDQASMHLRALSKIEQVKIELERIRLDPETPKNLDINSLLIMPIQRLPRYVLLLQDLLAHTPANHVDFPDLQKALDGVVEVASEVNLKKKASDNVVAVALIRQHLIFSGMEQAVGLEKYFPNSVSRVYITQGHLHFFESEKHEAIKLNQICNIKLLASQWKTHYAFLFNDTLLITAEVEASQTTNLLTGWRDKIWAKTEELKPFSIEELRENTDINFKFIAALDLSGLEVIEPNRDPKAANDLNANAFALVKRGSKSTTQLLSCADEKQKRGWIMDFDGAIWNLLKNKRTRLELQKQPIPQKQVVSHSGSLFINFKGVPGGWVTKYCVIRGSSLVLYEGENDFLSAADPKKTTVLVDSADFLLWPAIGAATFLDLEKQGEYTAKEQAFLAKATGNLATIPGQAEEGKIIAQAGAKEKFYFMIDRVKLEDGSHQSWYFHTNSADMRMKWINKLRQALQKTLEPSSTLAPAEESSSSTPERTRTKTRK